MSQDIFVLHIWAVLHFSLWHISNEFSEIILLQVIINLCNKFVDAYESKFFLLVMITAILHEPT